MANGFRTQQRPVDYVGEPNFPPYAHEIGSIFDDRRRSGKIIFGPLSILPFLLASIGFHVFYPEL